MQLKACKKEEVEIESTGTATFEDVKDLVTKKWKEYGLE